MGKKPEIKLLFRISKVKLQKDYEVTGLCQFDGNLWSVGHQEGLLQVSRSEGRSGNMRIYPEDGSAATYSGTMIIWGVKTKFTTAVILPPSASGVLPAPSAADASSVLAWDSPPGWQTSRFPPKGTKEG